MGVFELHLHEPDFTLNTGETKSSTGFGSKSEPESEPEGEPGERETEPPSIAGKLGPLIVLAVIIALAKRVKRRRE
ncbi:hypothetical protein [Haladaptatus sp. T7]|uniref:hypothetical protein n=1 Tax=Haladaptatus sp. T7 TaxID=2029368 RepID=UPI0021A25815|nr:hypothetical protein [Haladaptatus sp. T7]GKZ12608.1 hypothetical protein HAL_04890 [Haladaptatus sp. T7]